MSNLTTWTFSRRQGQDARRRARPGWVGIDFGTNSMRLAQIERCGTGSRIAARWSLDYAEGTHFTDTDSHVAALQTHIAELKSLRRLFQGRSCAAVLPMSLVEQRSFEVPKGSASEQHRMTGEELAAEMELELHELAYGSWECSLDTSSDAAMARMAVSAVPRQLAEKLGVGLLSAGLECQVLDGMPCVMGRAVELAGLNTNDGSVVAINLCAALPLVVLVKDGRPLFSRTLRGMGMQSIMQPLQDCLELSATECHQLLVRYGVTAIGQQPTLATGKTMQIIAHPLQDLMGEIKRTVEYINQHFRACKPHHVCLFGEGALVKNLPGHISHQLHLPVSPWTLSESQTDSSDAIYGLAAGLSALAWEETECI